MPVKRIGQVGDAIVDLYLDVQGRFVPLIKIVKADKAEYIGLTLPGAIRLGHLLIDTAKAHGMGEGIGSDPNEDVELARLLVKRAAANGWGSNDPDRQRIIAWAQVKHG